MRIGLTYDLRDDYLAQGYSAEDVAELDREDTIAGIESAIRKLGHKTDRIGNGKSLLKKLVSGQRWDIVFNIAEGIQGAARESQVPAILEVFDIPYTFSDSKVLAIALDKGVTKTILSSAGLRTPAFAKVVSLSEVKTVHLSFPLFVKPMAEGSSKGISNSSLVRTRAQLGAKCSELLTKFQQPVLVEKYMPGREFTVGILGTGPAARVVGVMEIVFVKKEAKDTYSLFTKTNYERLVKYRIATGRLEKRCADLALSAWHLLGCRDAGRIDMRLDGDGAPSILEINPLPGLNYVYSDLPILCGLKRISFPRLIAQILASAFDRYPQLRRRKKARSKQ